VRPQRRIVHRCSTQRALVPADRAAARTAPPGGHGSAAVPVGAPCTVCCAPCAVHPAMRPIGASDRWNMRHAPYVRRAPTQHWAYVRTFTGSCALGIRWRCIAPGLPTLISLIIYILR
jgi:hypothetical protein